MTAYTTDPSAPEPKPWTARPAMTSGMSVATPAISSPTTKKPMPAMSARVGPCRSASPPASVMPMMFVSQKALNAQP
jgi:hypothetical protein